jgi:hypothetical protein
MRVRGDDARAHEGAKRRTPPHSGSELGILRAESHPQENLGAVRAIAEDLDAAKSASPVWQAKRIICPRRCAQR